MINMKYVGLVKVGDSYERFDRLKDADIACDFIGFSEEGDFGEMRYYDIRDEQGKNYINSLKPNETKTVCFGRILNEDELSYLYLNPNSGAFQLSDEALKIGYVEVEF